MAEDELESIGEGLVRVYGGDDEEAGLEEGL